jgi:hypothetical protein
MERRSLLAGLAVLVVCLASLAGTASARTADAKKPAGAEDPTCIITSQPSFVDQGEFTTSSSVADIVEVSCNPEFAFQSVKLSDEELFSRCRDNMSWSEAPVFEPTEGSTTTIKLDGGGNGSAVVWAGPGCASGETLVSAHLEVAPFTTVTTNFEVLPPKVTPPGVYALPPTSVEDNVESSVETIVEVEFPSVYAEQFVNISAEQLFARCGLAPKVEWIGPDEDLISPVGEDAFGAEGVSVQLDDDGNAFVVLLGGPSCASGGSEVEASLESAPYTTYTTEFTVKAPEAGL